MRLKNVLCTACAAAFAAVMFFGFNVKSFAADTYEGTLRMATLTGIEERTDENGEICGYPIYSDEQDVYATFISEGISYASGFLEINQLDNSYWFNFMLEYRDGELLETGNYEVTVILPVYLMQDEDSFLENYGMNDGREIPYTLNGNQISFSFDGSNPQYSNSGEGVTRYCYTFNGYFMQGKAPASSNDVYNANLESKANLINYYSGLGEGQKEPAVVELNEGDALNDGLIKAMSEAKNVVLKFTYTYEGVQYLTTVTPEAAKAAYDPEIPWYGPLFLRAHFPTVVVE